MKALIVASLVGMSFGHFGTTPLTQNSDIESASQPLRTSTASTTLYLPGSGHRSAQTNAEIAESVDAAASNIEDAISKAPSVARAMAGSINEHGPVRALLYEDPAVKEATESMGSSLGRGLRALADALRSDMSDGARHVRPQG